MSIEGLCPGRKFSGDRPGEAVAETNDRQAVDDAAPDGPGAALAVRRAHWFLTPAIRTLYEHIRSGGDRPLPIMTFHDT